MEVCIVVSSKKGTSSEAFREKLQEIPSPTSLISYKLVDDIVVPYYALRVQIDLSPEEICDILDANLLQNKISAYYFPSRVDLSFEKTPVYVGDIVRFKKRGIFARSHLALVVRRDEWEGRVEVVVRGPKDEILHLLEEEVKEWVGKHAWGWSARAYWCGLA